MGSILACVAARVFASSLLGLMGGQGVDGRCLIRTRLFLVTDSWLTLCCSSVGRGEGGKKTLKPEP